MPDGLDNPRIHIGANLPPEPIDPSPFEIAEKAVNDIYEETILWLDGKPIASQELADGVGNLLAEIRKAHELADTTRKAEKAVADEIVAEIQARYAPLIADTKSVKGKTVLAAAACKQALQPWLDAEDKRIKEAARLAREEADRQQAAAQEALQTSDAANLVERAAAEEQLAGAKKAETAANVAARQTAKAGGASGRSVALRTVYTPTIINEVEAARHVWTEARQEMLECLIAWAEGQVRLGVRSIPGFEITESKVPV